MRRARRARSRGSRCLERATFLWAWAKDNYARLAAWYGYRSTFATLVRALGKGLLPRLATTIPVMTVESVIYELALAVSLKKRLPVESSLDGSAADDE